MTLAEKMQQIRLNLGELYPLEDSTSVFYKIISELVAKPSLNYDSNIEYIEKIANGSTITTAEFLQYWANIIGVKNKQVSLGAVNGCTMKGLAHLIWLSLENVGNGVTITSSNTRYKITNSTTPSGVNPIIHYVEVIDAMDTDVSPALSGGNCAINVDIYVPEEYAIQQAVLINAYGKLITTIVQDTCVGVSKQVEITITEF